MLLWSLARVLYDAYHLHPASTAPPLPFDPAPTDVKVLWYSYAKDVLREWYTVKHLPRHKPWIEIEVKK